MYADSLQARCRLPLVLLAAVILAATTGTLHATPVASQFDDLPAPFVPGKTRNEAEIDRIEALARFAAGRTSQQRGDFAQAVRQFARADRLDPAATTARSNLVVAAVQAKQIPLAARYALKGIDPQEVGDAILGRLAIYLTEQGDLAHAIEFYEKSLAAAHPKGDSAEIAAAGASASGEDAADIFTRLELGRLYHLAGKYA
jgi:tetratricopeptide (TPR) repeat protein